jgi:hypothetical protein
MMERGHPLKVNGQGGSDSTTRDPSANSVAIEEIDLYVNF